MYWYEDISLVAAHVPTDMHGVLLSGSADDNPVMMRTIDHFLK